VANPRHWEKLLEGVEAWNRWRRKNPRVRPDLSRIEPSDSIEDDIRSLASAVVNEVVPGRAPTDGSGLSGADLNGIDFRRTKLARAHLDGAMLIEADLSGADLSGASLSGCILTGATMRRVKAQGADFNAATLRWADLGDADLTDSNLRLANASGIRAPRIDLRRADLYYANLVGADLREADLSGAMVYGVSAWDVNLAGACQERLIITTGTQPEVAVDDLQIAQFLHLIIANHNLRTVIDTLTTKVVLILGRFTPQRKAILEAVRGALRVRGFVPVIFDFERPGSRDFTETVVTLAHLARFIVADLTEPASLPKELEAIVPRLAVPVIPLLAHGFEPYAMFGDYWKYDWVLDIIRYRTPAALVRSFDRLIVQPAEETARTLANRRDRPHRKARRARATDVER
jgi:uncharacterized protein YjbI with pentapeptide repeats